MFAKLKTLFLPLLLTLPLAASALDRVELVPPDAQSYIHISDTTRFWSTFKESSVGQLWADPQFQDFLGNPDAETWQEVFFEGEPDTEDQVFLEQLKMLTGEVILAYDPKIDGPYIIAAMSADDFLRSLELDDQLKSVANTPFEIIKSTFQNVEISQHIENGGTPKESSYWQAHIAETIVVGGKKEWVEKCIVHLKKEAVTEPKGNPSLSLNLPLSKLINDEILEDMAQAPSPAYDPEVLFDALGLMGVGHFSFKLELKDTEMVADSTLRISDLTKGLFTLLDTQPSELPTVSFIPDDIASLEVGRINPLRFWQEIPKVLATSMPALTPQFDMLLAMLQQQIGINLEQDLLAHLGTKYLSFSTNGDGEPITVIALELKDGAAFKTGLETTLAAPVLQPQVATGLVIEEFLDHTVYTLKNADPDSVVAFGVVGNYLLYGHPNGLRQVIRTEASGEVANPSFEQSALVKGLRQHVPTRAFGYSAIDWKKNMDFIVRELSKPEYVTVLLQQWATSGSPLPPPDFNKRPSADHIASFFKVSYQYAEETNEGIHHRIILKY